MQGSDLAVMHILSNLVCLHKILTPRIRHEWPYYSIIETRYKMTQNKRLCQKPLASPWSEAMLWTIFLMPSPMFSWWTALRHHSDNQKEDEVTGTSTCEHARLRMNNTVIACPSLCFSHICAHRSFNVNSRDVFMGTRGNCKLSY